jgi:hypothetical protein
MPFVAFVEFINIGFFTVNAVKVLAVLADLPARPLHFTAFANFHDWLANFL